MLVAKEVEGNVSQALYRTYRSRSLAEIIGQEHITDTLARALKAGRIGHAYLLTGPRGTGKTSIARILAHEINGLPYSDAQHLDIIEIDAASNRRIDDIRDLREKVHITPISAKYKVYIIDEVHMLTGESFNALLKTLEEPPAHVVFILATTEAHKLPATIISRTQRFALRPVELAKVAAHLKTIADKEKIQIDPDALALIAQHGEGSFRDSISLLDQMAHVASGNITAAAVQNALGLAAQSHIEALIAAIAAGKQSDIAKTLETLEAQGATPSTLASQLARALTAVAPTKPQLYQLIDQLLEVPRAYNPGLKLLTTLMLFAANTAPEKPRSAAALVTAPSAVVEAPVVKKQPPKKEPVPAPSNHSTLKDITSADWVRLLHVIKKASPPLFSVLKNAQPSFEGDTLTLSFRYQLHRKKIDDPKQKVLLATFIQETLGGSAGIATAVSADASPPPLTDDPVVSSVANIMGGGEMVDAKEI